MCRGLFKALLILLCAVQFVCAKDEPQHRENLKKPDLSFEKRFKDSAPRLVMILQLLSEIFLSFSWLLDSILSIVLCILQIVVTCCTDILHKTFGVLFSIVQLLQALGFGVKCILEINYSVVSCLLNNVNAFTEKMQHAVDFVKFTVVNETNHAYQSSLMALVELQNVLSSTFWSSALVIKDNFEPHMLAVVDNFQKTNFTMIANTTVATTKFFFESVLVTSHVLQNGCLFLLSYVSGVLGNIYGSVLACVVFSFTSMFRVVAVLFEHFLVFLTSVFTGVSVVLEFLFKNLITLPFQFLVDIACKTVRLGYTYWRAFTNACSLLDESARNILKVLFQSTRENMQVVMTTVLNMINLLFPGGVLGLLMTVLVTSLLYMLRTDIAILVRCLLEYLPAMNRRIQDDGEDEGNIPQPARRAQPVRPAQPAQSHPSGDGQQPETSMKDENKLLFELEREKDKRLCVICQENVKTVLLLPCRHVCLCSQCLQELRHGHIRLVHCPLCRRHVQSTMDVFV